MNQTVNEIILNESSSSNNITNVTNYSLNLINHSSSSDLLNTSNLTYTMMQIDPNWFYSASAQSAAAIVGLMGAFITTKLVNHKAFVTQLKKEITEYEKKNRVDKQRDQTQNSVYIGFRL